MGPSPGGWPVPTPGFAGSFMSRDRFHSWQAGHMPADLSYAHEKYATAVRIMALGEGNLRERLLDAYLSQASRAHPPRGGLGRAISADVQQRIDDFHARMTAVPATHGEGTIMATITSLPDAEVRGAAEELLAIADEINWEWCEHRNLKP